MPSDLGDLHTGEGVGQAAVKDHVSPDEPRDRIVDEHRLSPKAWKDSGRKYRGGVVSIVYSDWKQLSEGLGPIPPTSFHRFDLEAHTCIWPFFPVHIGWTDRQVDPNRALHFVETC